MADTHEHTDDLLHHIPVRLKDGILVLSMSYHIQQKHRRI